MNPVVQQDRTGCGIAAVAAITGQTYAAVKQAANTLGIAVSDPRLWTDPEPIRRLLARFGVAAGAAEAPFRGWPRLPACALLAIKWHREKTGPAWHWVVFVRAPDGPVVLDSKRGLRRNRRTDFGRIQPKWFIPIGEPARTPPQSD